MLSVCPDLTVSFYYSRPGRGSSHFVAYSSCYCSLSALWDACPDPPWHVTLEMTLSIRLTAGSQTPPCVPVSIPLPSLSVRCSSPSISASPRAVQVFTLSNFMNHVSLKNSFLSVHEFVAICHSCHTKFLQGLRAEHNPGTALWCVLKSVYFMVACQALLFRQYNNQTNVSFFSQSFLLVLLFLTVPVISHVLISQGNTLESNYILPPTFTFTILIHLRPWL